MKTIDDNQILDLQHALEKLKRVTAVMKEGSTLWEDILEVESTLRVVLRNLK